MAVESVSMVAPRVWPARPAWTLADSAFVIFLLLIFVSLSPFATRDPVLLAAAPQSGAGDLLRELAYSCTFLLIGFSAIRAKGVMIFRAVPPSLGLLLLWCTLSAAWAPAPDVAFRRAVLESLIVASVLLGSGALGVERSFALLRGVLATVLLVNCVSILLVRNAVHLPGEIDPGLVGDWRGIYFHKNIAGAVSALTAILFFFQALRTRSVLNGALCIAAVGFTIMTRSKSSLALLAPAIIFATGYRLAWQNGINRAIAAVIVLLVATVAVALLAAEWEQVSHALSDPGELTGRTAIWQGEIAFIRDHFWLGAGFGSFSDTGGASLFRNYIADTWVQNTSHGHNAYLQLLVTIGAIGFVLAIIAFVVAPLREFWRIDPANLGSKTMLFALFVFMLPHNFVESDFLEGDGPAWVVFLLMLAALREFFVPGQSRMAVRP